MSAPTKEARAYCNGRVVQLWWDFGEMIPDCLGVMIERIYSDDNKTETLPAWIPFEGQDNSDWKRGQTSNWPIQSDQWKDLFAKPGKKLRYRITPRVGTPGNLTSRADLALTTNEIVLTSQHGIFTMGVNNGILSTQSLARKLGKGPDGKPDWQKLVKAINTPGDKLRERLAGDLIPMLKSLILRARSTGGRCLLALYELSDPELVELLLTNLDVVEIILGNAGKDDDTNKEARAKLHAAGAKVHDRILPQGELPHNKFVVWLNADSKPMAVLTGSTNWTPTGLCAQSNCAFLIECAEIAQLFADYWHRMLKDGTAQSEEFRLANAAFAPALVQADGSKVTVCFSPNTKERVKPPHQAPTPPDMQLMFDHMDATGEMFLFHLFMPGFPSVLGKADQMQKTRPEILIRGIVNSPDILPKQFTPAKPGEEQQPPAGVALYHRTGTEPDIIAAAALEEALGPEIPELLKASPEAHAITHFKGWVKDPMDPVRCVCAFGSHNMGFKASYQNDENLIIVEGNQPLALAIAVYILDIYSHYRTRFMLAKRGMKWNGFLSTDAAWQAKYLTDGPARKELLYWLGRLTAAKSA